MAKKSFSVQKRSPVKLGLLVLGLLAFLLVLAKVLSFMVSLYAPSGISLDKDFSWDGESSVNIVYSYPNGKDSSSQSLLSYNPQSERITILDVSNDTYFELPRDHGWWRIGSVFELGKNISESEGAELLKLSTSKLVGLPVDAVVVVENGGNELKKTIENFQKNNFSIFSFVNQSKSDMSKVEQVSLYWKMSQVRPDKVVSLDFQRSSITESKLLPDSSRVLGINTVSLDTFIRENLNDETIFNEGFEVAIFNGTTYPGLTQNAARMVTNLGGTVINVGNTTKPQKTSTMVIKKKEAEGTSLPSPSSNLRIERNVKTKEMVAIITNIKNQRNISKFYLLTNKQARFPYQSCLCQ